MRWFETCLIQLTFPHRVCNVDTMFEFPAHVVIDIEVFGTRLAKVSLR